MMQLKYSTSSTLVSTELELYFKSNIIILIFLYRATMERTRNYIQNGQFSGEFFKEIFASTILFSIFAGNESKNALPDYIKKQLAKIRKIVQAMNNELTPANSKNCTFFRILSHPECKKYDLILALYFISFFEFCIFQKITHTYTHYMFLICFAFAFYTSPIIFFSFFFILSNTGTESEVSFSLLNGSRNHNNRHSGLDNSTTTTSTRILMSPGTKPVKIAAISGKPRVQRYLSRECE